MSTQRRAILRVSASNIVELCKRDDEAAADFGYFVEHSLPGDAVAIGGRYDSITDCVEILVESGSLEPIEEGARFPVLEYPADYVFHNEAAS